MKVKVTSSFILCLKDGYKHCSEYIYRVVVSECSQYVTWHLYLLFFVRDIIWLIAIMDACEHRCCMSALTSCITVLYEWVLEQVVNDVFLCVMHFRIFNVNAFITFGEGRLFSCHFDLG